MNKNKSFHLTKNGMARNIFKCKNNQDSMDKDKNKLDNEEES